MADVSSSTIDFPVSSSRDVLSEVLRAGAQKMLTTAIEAEVAECVESHLDLRDEMGHWQVIRSGHLPKLRITTGAGPIEVRHVLGR